MRYLSCFVLFIGLILVSCNKEEKQIERLKQSTLDNYADLVYAGYEDSYQTALLLQQAIQTFTDNPTAAGLDNCKTAWLNARQPYNQTEAFRFYGGPIDAEDGPEGLINAWPMDENFIDYTVTEPNAGLINNPAQYPDITREVLLDLNEKISETSIFTGYHAIEFLLWGQDLSADGPGARPYTDYIAGGTAQNQTRRAQYLKVVTALLIENLATVRDQWAVNGDYRDQFLNNTDTDKALGHLFTSLGELSKGELAGERMFVAIDTKDQENEHSCFSDNTINDISMNFKGIENVYFGTYQQVNGQTISGASIDQLIEKVDATKCTAARVAFENAKAKIYAIPTPFDQTITANPLVVADAITALRQLSDRMADVGFALGATF